MRWNSRVWPMALMLTTLLVACCGSSGNGAKPLQPEVRYLPSPTAKPCLTNPPPKRPGLSCTLNDPEMCACAGSLTAGGADGCESLRVARLLDYEDALDRWVRLYAWPLCKVPS
jgi:hypothetical protein